MTLTMRDIVEIGEAYKLYTAFGKRLRYMHGNEMSWIAVPEFQKRGAVHFHVLVWGLNDEAIANERNTRALASLWGHGFIDIVKTDGNARLASYLAKYMSKAMHDIRLVGKRGYSASRNVLRPVSLVSPFQVRFITQHFGLGGDNAPLTRERSYETMYMGRCVYKQFSVHNSHENRNSK